MYSSSGHLAQEQGSSINITSSTIHVFFKTLPSQTVLKTRSTSITQRAESADRGQLTDIAQIHACFFDPFGERLLTFADPDARVIELRMGDKRTFTFKGMSMPSCSAGQLPRGFQPGS